jgi:hypothetical protein
MRKLALLLAALLPALAAAETPADYAATAPVTLTGDGPYYRLTLPIQAYFAARHADLQDLRVFNGAGEAMPFTLLYDQPRTERTEQQVAVKWFPIDAPDASADALRQVRIERRTDGTIVSVLDGDTAVAPKRRGYLLDLSQAKDSALKLELDWDPASTGFQRLSVEASDDLQSWQVWDSAAQLARLDFNGQQVERRQIDLPGGRAAYLRLTWQSPAEAPELTAAVLTEGSATDHPADYVWSEPAAPSRSDQGSYEWDFPQPIAPERLRLALAQDNVLARVALAGRSEAKDATWRDLGRSVLYRLLIDGKPLQQPEIPVSTAPLKALRLTPDANAGLGGAPTLSVGVSARQLIFLARGAGPFTLAVGREAATPAELPAATLMPGWGSSTAPPVAVASLGPLAILPGHATSSQMPAGGWQAIVLWVVLLLGIGAIGFMAMRLLRQIKA